MYAAATTKVIPNMNMQTAPTISPVRMFFLARRRFTGTAKDSFRPASAASPASPASAARPVRRGRRARTSYTWTSATIAQKSNAR